MKKTTRFRNLLASAELEFICEAHNGLSARIAEEAGFRGVWGSGLTISAQLGVRDNNEASWTQVMDVIEFMADATSVPIMLDGDTGYGNFNNVQRLVRKLEQRGVAAVCIEDKVFPKTNSFISGERQPLADIDEFCGKIKAGKDAQADDDFSVVARVEAFIAGRGLAEALRRAEAYHAAGADGILMHSALSSADEIVAFTREWNARCPVVIVPTKYYSTPVDVFREQRISMVIWANHLLRSAISAMQETARVLHETQSLARLEQQVAPVAEIFRLQGAHELEKAEQRYLPESRSAPAALVLAASRGAELRELTEEKPKAMVRIGERPLLAHIAASFHDAGITDITVVRGYRKEAVNLPDLTYVDNDDYADTGELHSLWKGLASREWGAEGLIVCYGDVLFRKYVLDNLRALEDDLVIPVDTQWQDSVNRGRDVDYVSCTLPYSRTHYNRRVLLQKMSGDLPQREVHGEWMGLLYISGRTLPAVRAMLHEMHAAPHNRTAKMPALLNRLAASGHEVRVVYTSGNWLDVDSLDERRQRRRILMIESSLFVEAARGHGFGLWTGVPCSYLTSFLNEVIANRGLKYVAACNEGEAVAIAVGSHIGGRRAIAMFQNSGLGNAVSPLTSLAHTHRTPVLLIVSRRGDPQGAPDEPQHELMGEITTRVLDVVGIRWELFPETADAIGACLDRAIAHMDATGLAYALVMRKGAVAPGPAPELPPAKPLPAIATTLTARAAHTKKREYLAALQRAATERDILVSTTGYTSRELYALGDHPNQLYVVGAMGCVSSVGLGLALARPDVRVTVIDGDGSALMRLAAFAAIGYERPPNLLHIVLDNGMHESTGGQFTFTSSVDLAAVASACGYPAARRVYDAESLATVFAEPRRELGFVCAAVAPGVPPELPRPTITPPEVTRRLRDHLARLERSR